MKLIPIDIIPKLTYKIKCMGLPKRLTEMQIKFAHELVTNEGRMTGTEAAIAAGYSEDTAKSAASKLQNPKEEVILNQELLVKDLKLDMRIIQKN